jgi:hypothetical protein
MLQPFLHTSHPRREKNDWTGLSGDIFQLNEITVQPQLCIKNCSVHHEVFLDSGHLSKCVSHLLNMEMYP